MPSGELLLKCNKFDVEQITTTGEDGRTLTRQVIRHPGAVVIVPVLPDGSVVMIDNFRPTVDAVLLELPAGTLERDEPAETTAHRELIEETGYRAGKMVKLHEFYSSPGISDEIMHLFVASELEQGAPQREAGEEIENRIVSREEIEQMLRAGQIIDAKTLTGLLLWLRSG